MESALKSRSREKIATARDHIEKQVERIAPPPPDAAWRENVEVFLVAIVIAAGVRAYFLQPFKIPTGSMQPTLYGIVGYPTQKPAPNILTQAFEMVWLGRHHVDLVAKEDDTIKEIQEHTYVNFFTFTDIIGEKNRYKLFAPEATLRHYFGVSEGRSYRKGEPIAQGYIDTGDQVFVDKLAYNFVKPTGGDVFVFKTTGIGRIRMPEGVDSQHYIKRLAGTPGQTLRIDSPKLFIDGKLADKPPFQRVMSCKDLYRGYSNPSEMQGALYLTSPEDTVTLGAKSYFALGDNSYQSSDSRFWGTVPEQNIAGRGLFVYWPFSKRWGLIH
jgi:signal peptidase I